MLRKRAHRQEHPRELRGKDTQQGAPKPAREGATETSWALARRSSGAHSRRFKICHSYSDQFDVVRALWQQHSTAQVIHWARWMWGGFIYLYGRHRVAGIDQPDESIGGHNFRDVLK
jgi:hypothetical protein